MSLGFIVHRSVLALPVLFQTVAPYCSPLRAGAQRSGRQEETWNDVSEEHETRVQKNDCLC